MPGSCSGIMGRSSLGVSCYIHTLLWGNTSADLWAPLREDAILSHQEQAFNDTAEESLCCTHCFMLPLWTLHKQSTSIVHAPTYIDTYTHHLWHICSSVDMVRRCWKLPNFRSKSPFFVENYQPFIYSVYKVIHFCMMVLTANNYYFGSKRKRWLYLSKKALTSAGTEDFRFFMVQCFLLTFKAAS